uniref:Transmembrane protein 79-like n=1 Tax=Crassostrea virginica TaxID=6565 RepID=A0A8B8CXU2_CRAVI|nr:transmembrane protein 79-like [Crassostrea virginica]
MSDKQKDKRSWQEKKASVRKQIATSVAISSTVFVVSYLYLPIDTSHLKDLCDRLALTISCLFVSSFSIFVGIFGVTNVRGNTDAIDPVEGGSENLVFVPNQILRNTTEQFLLHFIAMMTLTLFLEGASMKVIPILCGIFLVARIVYQVGYMASAMSRDFADKQSPMQGGEVHNRDPGPVQ